MVLKILEDGRRELEPTKEFRNRALNVKWKLESIGAKMEYEETFEVLCLVKVLQVYEMLVNDISALQYYAQYYDHVRHAIFGPVEFDIVFKLSLVFGILLFLVEHYKSQNAQ